MHSKDGMVLYNGRKGLLFTYLRLTVIVSILPVTEGMIIMTLFKKMKDYRGMSSINE